MLKCTFLSEIGGSYINGWRRVHSKFIIVGNVEQKCPDTTSKYLNGCRRTRKRWQAVSDMWCRWTESTWCNHCVLVVGSASRSFPDDRIVRDSLQSTIILKRYSGCSCSRTLKVIIATLYVMRSLMDSQCNERRSTVADEWYGTPQTTLASALWIRWRRQMLFSVKYGVAIDQTRTNIWTRYWQCGSRSHFIKSNISANIKPIWTNFSSRMCRSSFLYPRKLPPLHGCTPQTSHLFVVYRSSYNYYYYCKWLFYSVGMHVFYCIDIVTEGSLT